jgi:hypothetical protein
MKIKVGQAVSPVLNALAKRSVANIGETERLKTTSDKNF